MLTRLADAYREEPARVVELASQLTAELSRAAAAPAGGPLPTATVIDAAVTSLASAFDPVNGGFGQAPKFPEPATLELLLRHYRRTRDEKSLAMATTTLEAMARGALFDQLGGGFHRYTTDSKWRVPHFEKMLYDNAQLATLYLDAYQLTANPEFAVTAHETLSFLDRELRSPEGAFFGALDADSLVGKGRELHEGAFYTWTPAELVSALGPSVGAHLTRTLGVTATGQVDGRSTLDRGTRLEVVAAELGISVEVLRRELDAGRARLLAARARRPRPARDEKIITAWNGLAISAFARGAIVLEDPALGQRAVAAAEFVATTLLRDGRLARSWRLGRATGAGTLEDYAFLEQGLLDLHEATQSMRWLELAVGLQSKLDELFLDPVSGAYFRVASDGQQGLFRELPDVDGAEPSGNSVAALNLLRLAELVGDSRLKDRALGVLRAQATAAHRGFGAAKLLCAVDFAIDTPSQVVIVESTAGASAGLLAAMRTVYAPNHVLVVATQGEDQRRKQAVLSLLEGRSARKGLATAYVCRHRTCALPTSDPAVFRGQLEGN